MGLEIDLILSNERHYGSFCCPICQSLVDLDAYITTKCSHCFCRPCLYDWLQRQQHSPSKKCPTCNQDLLYHNPNKDNNNNNNNNNSNYAPVATYASMMIGDHTVCVQPLANAQPLAHRLLRNILVECPLKAKGIPCQWQGDYGDLQEHLLSSTAHSSSVIMKETKKTMTTRSSTAMNGGVDDDDDDDDEQKNKNDTETTSPFVETVGMDDQKPEMETIPMDEEEPFMSERTNVRGDAEVAGTTLRQQQQEQQQQQQTLLRQQLSLASSLKEEGNLKFESRHFQEAISLYTKAMEVLVDNDVINVVVSTSTNIRTTNDDDNDVNGNHYDDDPVLTDIISNMYSLLSTLCSNRAATYLHLQKFSECLQDCNVVLHTPKMSCNSNNNNNKLYVRASRALVQMGKLSTALEYVQEGLSKRQLTSTSSSSSSVRGNAGGVAGSSVGAQLLNKEEIKIQNYILLEEQGKDQLSNQQYAAAKASFGTLLKETGASSAVPFLIGVAQADLGLGLADSALRLTKRILLLHGQNPYGFWIRGQAVFLMAEADSPKVAIQLLQQALRLDPDSKIFKTTLKNTKKIDELMEVTKRQIRTRQFESAILSLTECIQLQQKQSGSSLPSKSPLYAKLYTQRAEAKLRLKQYAECLKDVALVLYAQEDHLPAWLIKFNAYHGLEQHEAALEEINDIYQRLFPQEQRLRHAYERADFLVRKSKRVDFYKLLQVPSIASEMEIKKAYKKRALELHPDRKANASLQEQKHAQEQFQLLGQGLELLTNEFTRNLYDEGYDPEAIRERVEAAKQAAHHPHHHHPRGHRHGHGGGGGSSRYYNQGYH